MFKYPIKTAFEGIPINDHPHPQLTSSPYLSKTTAAILSSEKITSPAQNSFVAFNPLPFPGESNIATVSIVGAPDSETLVNGRWSEWMREDLV